MMPSSSASKSSRLRERGITRAMKEVDGAKNVIENSWDEVMRQRSIAGGRSVAKAQF